MNTAPAKLTIAAHDQADALRIVEAAVTIAAIPRLVSSEARDLATRRLRELASGHPHAAEILAAVVLHLESCS